ncbi:alanine racemase [Mesorhizobium sp. B2-1-8]|uniref:alanine racemase n=1 Tax=Mesorhizobium sp. B2-1-8 TaxID=2589967 RepID=UPI0039EE57E8
MSAGPWPAARENSSPTSSPAASRRSTRRAWSTGDKRSGPQVAIDLGHIERNARTVVDRCALSGIKVFGVTKGTCGMPQVARAMLRGGVAWIAESRFENIRRLRHGR